MPSADFPYAISAPYGLLTRRSACCRVPLFVFLSLWSMARRWTGRGIQSTPGILVHRFSLYSGNLQRQLHPRRRGPPGVSSDYFQRTIVRYTGFDLMTDRGLCPVLRTRPGLAPPQICLPSTLLGYGAYLYVDPRFCLRLPSGVHLCYHPCPRLPFASVRLGLDFARYMCHNTGQHHLAAGPSPAHNKSIKLTWKKLPLFPGS